MERAVQRLKDIIRDMYSTMDKFEEENRALKIIINNQKAEIRYLKEKLRKYKDEK